ncbi:MAG: hypothetical protein QM757_06490 [Paludibaculum sp.]
MNADGLGPAPGLHRQGPHHLRYFLKDNRHIVYASTHEAAEACPAPPDRSKGYVWGVFDGYHIYVADDTGKNPKKLTSTARL